jgi:hypothetical protein
MRAMLRTIAWLAALCVPALLLVGPAFAQKEKDKDKDKDKDLDKEKATQWVKVTTIQGKVTAVYEDKRKLRVQIQVPTLQPNGRTYKIAMQAKDVEVQAIDDVVVRLSYPKPDFDDKGRPKKFTKAELKELKGDSKLPGYKAEFGDVQTDQIVQITVVRKKGAPASKAKVTPKKGKAKGKDADDIDALAEDTTPQVSMIMVLAQPSGK